MQKIPKIFNSSKKYTNQMPVSEQKNLSVNYFVNEFWANTQRSGNSLHEISYRACFKPQLVNFIQKNFSKVGEKIYDPFGGRGTTAIESALNGYIAYSNDINPLHQILTKARLNPPQKSEIERELSFIKENYLPKYIHKNLKTLANLCYDQSNFEFDIQELEVFFHKQTLKEILILRLYISEKKTEISDWIRLIATNRLTGHSKGFFSVYTLPPNLSASIKSQIKINNRKNQIPSYRDIITLINKKSKSLLRKLSNENFKILQKNTHQHRLFTSSADNTPLIKNGEIDLVITSPPFLNLVDYKKDNWLKNWFNGIQNLDNLWQSSSIAKWEKNIANVLTELKRVIKKDGHIAFEVGEAKKNIMLDENITKIAHKVGLNTKMVLINSQNFTKTSNIWGVKNNTIGTNTNRIVILNKN